MRYILIIILIFKGLLIFSQEKSEPHFFLNSKEIDINKVKILPTQIVDMKIENKTSDGEIYIITKDRKFTYYTLKDIVNQDTKLNYQKDHIVYKIFTQGKSDINKNGLLLTDTVGVKIDASYYISTTIDSLSNLKYLDNQSQNIYILNINLDTIAPQTIYYVKKPVIYLYPKSEIDIHLKINFFGKLKTTYPLYDNGWSVHAFPNGEIKNIVDDKEYSYLFWDGILNQNKEQPIYENGYVVKSDTALQFLQNILPQTGLIPREYNDFIVYWLPYLQTNQFTFIHFRTGDNYDIISKNEVSPKPDNQIRVFMEFKAVD